MNVLISVNTSYFFCNIGHFRAIDTPCRNDSRQYIVVFFRLKAQGRQDGNHIFFRNIRAEEVIDPLCRKVDAANFLGTYIFVDNAGRYFTSSHLLQQLSRPIKGVNTTFRIESSFKTSRRFGTKSQRTSGLTNRRPLKRCAFQDNRCGFFRYFRIEAAHNTGNTACLFSIGNDQHIFRQLPFNLIQGRNLFSFLCSSGNEFMSGQLIVIVCM